MKEIVLEFLKKKKKLYSPTELSKKLNIKLDEINDILYNLELDFRIISYDGLYMYKDISFYLKGGVVAISNRGNYYITCDHKYIILNKKDIKKYNIVKGDHVYVECNKDSQNGIVKSVVRYPNTAHFVENIVLKKDDDNNFFFIDKKKKYLIDTNSFPVFKGDVVNLLKCDNIYKVVSITSPCSMFQKFIYTNNQIKALDNKDYKVYGNYKFNEGEHLIGKYHVQNKTIILDSVKKETSSLSDNIMKMALLSGISTTYPKYTLYEESRNNVKDLRNLMTFTIDPETAKDLDDAVSLEKLSNGEYLLYVHIADVSSYIEYKSDSFNDAIEKGRSIYPSKIVIPMLPEVLSNKYCSLNPLEDKKTITFVMKINDHGKIIDFDYYRSIINSNMKMSYDVINEYFEYGKVNENYLPYYNKLNEMKELSSILDTEKYNRGSITFNTSEKNITVTDEGKIIKIEDDVRGPANKMIENFMLSANYALAKYLSYVGNPLVYRNHEKPDVTKLYTLKKKLANVTKVPQSLHLNTPKKYQEYYYYLKSKFPKYAENYLSTIFLSSLERAYYSDVNKGHYGLALDVYATVTSPIRRGSDLLNHYSLCSYLNLNTKFDIDDLEELIHEKKEHLTSTEEDGELFESDVKKYLINNYLKDDNSVLKAKIVFITNNTLYIKREDNIDGYIKLENDYIYDYHNHNMLYNKNLYKIGDYIYVTRDLTKEDLGFKLVRKK